MPATVRTIDRDQREGLYELVRNHLGSIEDFFVALERTKDFAKAGRNLAQEDRDSTAPAFPNIEGEVIDPNNLRRRVLKPLVEEVGAPWAAFHTFRHTFASIHLSEGTSSSSAAPSDTTRPLSR